MRPNLQSFWNYEGSPNTQPSQHSIILGTRGHCMFFRLDGGDTWFPNDILDFLWWFEDSLATFDAVSNWAVEDADLIDRFRTGQARDRFTIYLTGSSYLDKVTGLPGYYGMYWSSVPAYPIASPNTFYFGPKGSLSTQLPSTSTTYSYIYNPFTPVPSLGGNNLFIACGPYDQRPVEKRPDVLLFNTGVFVKPVIVFGAVNVTLVVSSNCTDTDFTVKLTDVFPDGESILLSDQMLRMRWRAAVPTGPIPPPITQPTLMVPGQRYTVSFQLWPIAHLFAPGHQLRIAISSSNYPRFSANPNNGLSVLQGGPLLIAQNSFYVGAGTPSSIVLPIVSQAQLPDNVL